FDHPPMVALFIRAGDSIIHNEFGLRLVNIISSTASLYILWQIVNKYNTDALWFILVAGGMFTLHIYGFITTPDGPLLFFTVLFFYVYRLYLEKNTWQQAVMLGIIIACLLYSKYHAILLIGFTVLANFKMLNRWSFWLIVVIAVVLYIPHILWQVQHDYPSLTYHLGDRSEKVYRFDYTFNYIISQIAVAGPLIGWLLFYKGVALRSTDTFTRGLKVNFIGIMLFFLLTSVRGEVQSQWTIIAFPALAILVLAGFSRTGNPPLWFRRLAIVNICIILIVRLLLIAQPPFVKNIQAVKSFFYNDEWAHTIKNKVGNNWLVMNDGFQMPARYCFYNNTLKCFSYDSRYYRLTQYEIWPMEDSVQGKRVYYLLHNPTPGFDTIQTAAGPWYGAWIDDVRTYQKVKIKTEIKSIVSAPGKKNRVVLSITNPYKYAISFSNTEYKNRVDLEACFSELKNEVLVQTAGDDFNYIRIKAGETANYSFTFTAPTKKGRYDLLFSLHTQPFNGTKNSGVISFTVE
ncbi:MAG: glycosyltransferase family 39 protein, partial [Mucilaginibacter sp.]